MLPKNIEVGFCLRAQCVGFPNEQIVGTILALSQTSEVAIVSFAIESAASKTPLLCRMSLVGIEDVWKFEESLNHSEFLQAPPFVFLRLPAFGPVDYVVEYDTDPLTESRATPVPKGTLRNLPPDGLLGAKSAFNRANEYFA